MSDLDPILRGVWARFGPLGEARKRPTPRGDASRGDFVPTPQCPSLSGIERWPTAESVLERDEAVRRPPRSYVSAPVWPSGDWLPPGAVKCMTQLGGWFGLASEQFP